MTQTTDQRRFEMGYYVIGPGPGRPEALRSP